MKPERKPKLKEYGLILFMEMRSKCKVSYTEA